MLRKVALGNCFSLYVMIGISASRYEYLRIRYHRCSLLR
jgi:hypothetical protein